MPVDFNGIRIGSKFTRPQLTEMWGYSGYAAISRGVVTPSGTSYVILFVTKEKQESLTQYDDELSDGILRMDGEKRHTSDQRIIETTERGDEIHLFYRERHHLPFTYMGKAYLTDYELHSDRPSNFRFALNKSTAVADEAVLTEERTHGGIESGFIPDAEGQKRLGRHIATSGVEKTGRERLRFTELRVKHAVSILTQYMERIMRVTLSRFTTCGRLPNWAEKPSIRRST